MKTIKIMIAASEELHDEKLEFSSLVEHLNQVLKPRGIELKRIKWDPEQDGSIEDFQAKLQDCEMCLNLYWRQLAANSEGELNTAYQQLKDGHNPRNLYVFFKEPTNNLSEALRDFKANFVTNYGHFFCKFENVDTMNLHFILQFEAYQNHIGNSNIQLIEVGEGKVRVGGVEIVNLDNVPFTKLNEEYQKLQHSLLEIDKKIADTKLKYKINPDNDDLLNKIVDLKKQRDGISKDFNKYQNLLYDTALTFAMNSYEGCSERMKIAYQFFEEGNFIAADEMLGMEELEREDKAEQKQYKQLIKNRELKMREYLMKAKTVMLNEKISVSERIDISVKAYERSLYIANEIRCDDDTIAHISFLCAQCVNDELIGIEREEKAVKYYTDALTIYKRLAIDNSSKYLERVVQVQHFLSIVYQVIGQYKKSERVRLDAIKILDKLSKQNSIYMSKLANEYICLADLYEYYDSYLKAENSYFKAISIYKELTSDSNGLHLSELADAEWMFAAMLMNIERYEDSIHYYLDSIEIYQSLKEDYLSEISEAYVHIAYMQKELKRYEDSETNYIKGIKVGRFSMDDKVESVNLEGEDLAWILNLRSLLKMRQGQYKEADLLLSQSILILNKLDKEEPGMYDEIIEDVNNNIKTVKKHLKVEN